MKVQVVLGQVGKGGHVEPAGVHPVQVEAVGGHLHHDVGHAVVPHVRQDALQVEGLVGRAGGRHHRPAVAVVDGADDAGGEARLDQNVFYQIGDGGLAVRAGHPDDGQVP